MTKMTVLQPGDPFPSLTVALPGGRTLRLPDALAGRFGVVLYYRGSWCPYCNAQLSAFQRSLDSLADMDASVVALSVAAGRPGFRWLARGRPSRDRAADVCRASRSDRVAAHRRSQWSAEA
jgi:alkyl hydroperoxide reductase subunit AhpC